MYGFKVAKSKFDYGLIKLDEPCLRHSSAQLEKLLGKMTE
jgi:hypothetical protein